MLTTEKTLKLCIIGIVPGIHRYFFCFRFLSSSFILLLQSIIHSSILFISFQLEVLHAVLNDVGAYKDRSFFYLREPVRRDSYPDEKDFAVRLDGRLGVS